MRDGYMGGSGVSKQLFRVVTDSPEKEADFNVANRAPPPRSNPEDGAVIDSVSIRAVELLRAEALSRSAISYTTTDVEGVTSAAVTCELGHHCDVPLPSSCGSVSAAAATARGTQFTCCTGTQVQILTLLTRRRLRRRLM